MSGRPSAIAAVVRETGWRRGLLLLAALTALAMVVAGCGRGASDERSEVPGFSVVPYATAGSAPFPGASSGQEVSIAGAFAAGRPVVMNLWGADCPPCRAEMPAFQAVADEFAGRVTVVGLDVGAFTALGTHDGARALLAELAIRYPNAYTVDGDVLKRYLVHGLPTTLFFAADGELEEKYQGPLSRDQLRGKVAELIADGR